MLFLWGNQQISQFQGGRHYGKDKITQMTLNKWFEEWFTDGKAHKAKETSISSMKKNFKRTFGFYIGTRKIEDIKPMDVQKAINAMEKDGMSNSAMWEVYTHVLDKKTEEELQKFGSAKTQEREAYAGLDVKKVKITALSHC